MEESSLIAIAKEFITKVTGELDPYTSQKGEIKVEGNDVILLTPSHIQFAKYGRGPGKNPPLDPILDFVSKNGIIFEGKDERGTAFAIQAGIAKNGTLNWVQNAPNAIDDAIWKWIDEYNRKVGDVFTVEVSEQVQKIYGNITSAGTFKI